MYFINHSDPYRNVSYDSYIHEGKIVNVSTSYLRDVLDDENRYVISVTRLPSSDGNLDIDLALRVAREMLTFISFMEKKEYDLMLNTPIDVKGEFSLSDTIVFDVVDKETGND